MNMVTATCADHFSSAAVDWLAQHLQANPDAVLALPTGSTPLGLYTRARERVAAGTMRLDRVRCFNLDEYVGVTFSSPRSFAYFLDAHLLSPCRVPKANVRLLRGDAPNLEKECADYEAALTAAGGIDVAILGMGANGHIAFNEPGTPWTSCTHVMRLTEETRQAYARAAATAGEIPDRGITMGIATIRAARAILLLVAGPSKREALRALLQGKPDIAWPVTSLLSHHALTLICAPDVGT